MVFLLGVALDLGEAADKERALFGLGQFGLAVVVNRRGLLLFGLVLWLDFLRGSRQGSPPVYYSAA